MHFQLQAMELKKLYQRYKPKEMCIDGTGLLTSPFSQKGLANNSFNCWEPL